MAVSPQYKEYFTKLYEYNIKKGVKLDSNPISEQEGIDDTQEIETPETAADVVAQGQAPVEFKDTEAIAQAQAEEASPEDKELVMRMAAEDELTRVKEIQDIQTSKIEELEQYLASLNPEIEELKMKTQDVDAMKDNLELLKQQVKEITPPTPEESLEKMAKISGGITMQDYWNSYVNQHEPLKTGTSDENSEEKKEYTVDVKTLKNMDNSVKDSFYNF